MKYIDGCVDAAFGYENSDGYVRILNKPRAEGGRLVMRHRWFWELYNGPIAEGYEVDHKCKNRRCFNTEHLQLLTHTEHRSKDNAERYLKDFEGFSAYVDETGLDNLPSQKHLGVVFNRTQSCISDWVKRYRKEK